jgi:hypothetical protein
LSLDCQELRIVPKLKEKHFSCYGSERQKVSLAAQLLSNHSATALQLISPEKKEQIKFVKLVNDWFDVSNSRRKHDNNVLKSGFGVSLDKQMAVIDEMSETMSQTRQISSKKLLPFQHGIIQWCYALKNLSFYVKENYNVEWIMASRVNQDHVENFFSQIRGLGATYDHPGPVELLNRARLLMIGQSETTATFAIEKAPVQFENAEENDQEYFMSVSLTATVSRSFSELVPYELFEPFESDNASPSAIPSALHSAPVPETTSDESDEAVSHETTSAECSEYGLTYFAGWLAFKFRRELPHLGDPTGNVETSELDPWLAHLSRGGLICPSKDFILQVKLFETHFQEFHGDKFSRRKNVFKTLHLTLCDMYPNVHRNLLLKYIRARTFFRIRYENEKLKSAKVEKRKKSRNDRKIQHFTT